MRVFAIWFMGIVSFGLLGSLVGFALTKQNTGEWTGVAAGACAFICLRLWLGERRSKSN